MKAENSAAALKSLVKVKTRVKRDNHIIELDAEELVPGDIVIVDRSLKPRTGNVVIAVLNGELLIRRYEEYNRRIRLVPETASLAAIDVDPGADFWVWGVVTYAIHSV